MVFTLEWNNRTVSIGNFVVVGKLQSRDVMDVNPNKSVTTRTVFFYGYLTTLGDMDNNVEGLTERLNNVRHGKHAKIDVDYVRKVLRDGLVAGKLHKLGTDFYKCYWVLSSDYEGKRPNETSRWLITSSDDDIFPKGGSMFKHFRMVEKDMGD